MTWDSCWCGFCEDYPGISVIGSHVTTLGHCSGAVYRNAFVVGCCVSTTLGCGTGVCYTIVVAAGGFCVECGSAMLKIDAI